MFCVNVETFNKKNGKLPAKLAEEMPRNKLCVNLKGPYRIPRKGKEPKILEAVTMIEPVTGWFEVTQYSKKKATRIANLVETMWLVRYPWPVKITYDQGGEFFDHNFKKILIEYEYGIKTNPASPGNPQADAIIERTQ